MRTRSLGYVVLGVLLGNLGACGGSGDGSSENAESEQVPTAITIRSATYGTALDARQQIAQPVQEFAPTDPVSISLELRGRPRGGVVTLRWPLGARNVDAAIDLASVNGSTIFSIGESTYVGGTLSHTGPLPPGEYTTIVLFEGAEVGRYPFRVVDAAGSAARGAFAGPFTTAPSDTLPPVVSPLPSATPVMHFAWNHPSLPANESLAFSLVAVDVGAAAPPMTTVATGPAFTAAQAGPYHGPLQFSLPRPWPPGSYRVVGVGSTLGPIATFDFTVQ